MTRSSPVALTQEKRHGNRGVILDESQVDVNLGFGGCAHIHLAWNRQKIANVFPIGSECP